MGYEKEELPQYQFAQIINQTENATLLNYGFLDGGFYMAADVLPTTKFFCRLNLRNSDFPEMRKEQERLIEDVQKWIISYFVWNVT